MSSKIIPETINKKHTQSVSPLKTQSIKTPKSAPQTKNKTQKKNRFRQVLNIIKTKTDLSELLENKESQINKLKILCSDANECLTFGRETDKIKKIFNKFTIPSPYIDGTNIKRLGKPSNNGFIHSIPYSINKYNINTVLKSAARKDADNLYYEALVGIYINKKNKIYSCFLETYNIYYYENEEVYKKFKNNSMIVADLNQIKSILTPPSLYGNYQTMMNEDIINTSCSESNYLCLHIQYLDNIQSMFDYIQSNDLNLTLYQYLYQVYCPLAYLSDEFTHYDLHLENVVIHKPSKDTSEYIQMIYHYPDNRTIQFKTFGIVKIIDYGRCYFYDKEKQLGSKDYYNKLCETSDNSPPCKPNCGEDVGYSILGPEDYPGSFYHISSQKPNVSHDLRLIFAIQKILNIKIRYVNEFGTPSMPDTYKKTGNIQNVRDMHEYLKQILLETRFQTKHEDLFVGKTPYGKLECWVDGSKPLQFTKQP